MSLRLIRPRLGELVLAGVRGHDTPVELRALAREFGLGGVLLRRANVTDVLQVADLAARVGDLARDVPAWVASHPDDNALASLTPPLTAWPHVAALGHADDLALTRRYAEAVARQALALGVTLTFAPVVDVAREGVAPVRGPAIGSDAERVAQHGASLVETWHALGLASCARHFPGLGAARADAGGTAVGAPLVEAPPDELARVDWVPFRAVARAGASAILVAHAFVPALDENAPACLSRRVVHDALRTTTGWTGLAIADDLARMPATTDDPLEHPAVRAIRAGCDVVLAGDGDPDGMARAIECLIHAAEQQALPVSRLEEALRRHEAAKADVLSEDARRRRPPRPSLAEALGRAEDEALAEQLRQLL